MENLITVILLLMGLPYENKGFHSFIKFTPDKLLIRDKFFLLDKFLVLDEFPPSNMNDYNLIIKNVTKPTQLLILLLSPF